MRGYFNNPTATAEVIDSEGWFHTGDIGNIDSEGFLAITDRKKEILVNAYGKNIAPAPIENELKSSRWIAQAVVIGDKRNSSPGSSCPTSRPSRRGPRRTASRAIPSR
jgi:long-chain acyl-CoA synthetase